MNLAEPYVVESISYRLGNNPNNLQSLEDSFFFDRFLGFIEKYDEVFEKHTLPTAEKWVAERDCSSISYFLNLYSKESMFHISYRELAAIPFEYLEEFQKKAQKIVPLLDEQMALYSELMLTYGK